MGNLAPYKRRQFCPSAKSLVEVHVSRHPEKVESLIQVVYLSPVRQGKCVTENFGTKLESQFRKEGLPAGKVHPDQVTAPEKRTDLTQRHTLVLQAPALEQLLQRTGRGTVFSGHGQARFELRCGKHSWLSRDFERDGRCRLATRTGQRGLSRPKHDPSR